MHAEQCNYWSIFKQWHQGRGAFESQEASLRISLVRDTYEQILSQFNLSAKENPIIKRGDVMENLKKASNF